MPSGIVRNRLRCASCNAIASPAQSKSLCVLNTLYFTFQQRDPKSIFFIHFLGSTFLRAKTFQQSTTPFLTTNMFASHDITKQCVVSFLQPQYTKFLIKVALLLKLPQKSLSDISETRHRLGGNHLKQYGQS